MDYSVNLSFENIVYLKKEGVKCIEEWLPIYGFNGSYEISDCGRVKSLERYVYHYISGKQLIPPYILKQYGNKGYRNVKLYKDGIGYSYSVHRLVAQAFIPNTENKQEVNHKGGKKAENSFGNLEWATHTENMHHAVKTGLKTKSSYHWLGKRGAGHPRSKPVNQLDMNGNFINSFSGAAEAKRILKIDNSSITKCIKGKTTHCGGYKWEYAVGG